MPSRPRFRAAHRLARAGSAAVAIGAACSVYDSSLLGEGPLRASGGSANGGSPEAGETSIDEGGMGGTAGASTGGAGVGQAGAASSAGGGASLGGSSLGGGGTAARTGGASSAGTSAGGVAMGGASLGGASLGGAPASEGGRNVSTGGTGGAEDEPACDDGMQNGSETAIDCGGADCAGCANGRACQQNRDCSSAQCIRNTCSIIDCTDDALNGNETDIDCGGADCPRCDAGRTCGTHVDCTTGVCDGELCATRRTCAEIKTSATAATSGAYFIDPDASGSKAGFLAYCDMTTAPGGFTRVGFEPAGSGGLETDGALGRLGVELGSPANVANTSGAGLIGVSFKGLYSELRLTWGSESVRFAVAEELFEDTIDTALLLTAFSTSNSTLNGWVSAAGGAVFCRASSTSFRPGDTSWAIVPRDNADTTCGCNGMGWTGMGIYYGGFYPADACTGWGGAFAGVKGAGQQKGGLASTADLMLWVR